MANNEDEGTEGYEWAAEGPGDEGESAGKTMVTYFNSEVEEGAGCGSGDNEKDIGMSPPPPDDYFDVNLPRDS